VVLVLATLRQEIRPAFLDRPSETAADWLESVGIFPGQAVFSPEFDFAGRNLFLTGRCLEVLASTGNAPAVRIFPRSFACPGTHLVRMDSERLMLTRLITAINDDESERRAGVRPPPRAGEISFADALLPAIAYHFDRQEKRRGTPRDQLTMLCSYHYVRYDTGERVVDPIVLARFRVGGGPGRVLWSPTEQQLDALWRPLAGR